MQGGIDKIIVRRRKTEQLTTAGGIVMPSSKGVPDTGEIIGLPVATTHDVKLNLGSIVTFAAGDGITIDPNVVVLHLTQVLAVGPS